MKYVKEIAKFKIYVDLHVINIIICGFVMIRILLRKHKIDILYMRSNERSNEIYKLCRTDAVQTKLFFI